MVNKEQLALDIRAKMANEKLSFRDIQKQTRVLSYSTIWRLSKGVENQNKVSWATLHLVCGWLGNPIDDYVDEPDTH